MKQDVGKNKFHLVQFRADGGNDKKKKIAKTLYTKDLAIDSELNLVPRAGVEPARVAPLVFETSASTDSAIWA